MNAVAGIQSCRLTTTSGFLSGKGWPDVVDLAAPGKYASILTEMGLETKGLEGNRDQMAQVNFTKLIKNLPTVAIIYLNWRLQMCMARFQILRWC